MDKPKIHGISWDFPPRNGLPPWNSPNMSRQLRSLKPFIMMSAWEPKTGPMVDLAFKMIRYFESL